MNLQEIIEEIKASKSDINEHIDTLIQYGSDCSHVTEMGVRGGNSTFAFIFSKPEKLISYDVNLPTINVDELSEVANENEVDFTFIQSNVLDIEIEETDLLFIDTWHAYIQLKRELELHGNKSTKYIIIHDTETFGYIDGGTPHYDDEIPKDRKRGLWPAIEEFVESNPHWIIHKKYENNNGLTILKRIQK